MNKSLILDNVSFKFSEKKAFFFENLSLSFAARSLHYIIGDNGSGKSTLLRLFLDNLFPEECLDGMIYRRGLVHLVAQDYNQMLAPSFSFEKNISFSQFLKYPRLSSLSGIQRMTHFIRKFNIPLNRPMSSFSGGQKQIASILMALQKPIDILLLDEPTAALDNTNASILLNFLSEIIGEMDVTVIMICHQHAYIKPCGESSSVYLSVGSGGETRVVRQRALAVGDINSFS